MNRTEFGFPIIDANEQKRILARPIAVAALLRNTTPCQCVMCRNIEMLPVVQRIVKSWRAT